MTIDYLAAAAALILVASNLISMALAGMRWRRPLRPKTSMDRPPVSILRPLRGVETFSEETIAATFNLDWSDHEIIFCVQSPADPVIGIVEAAIARHPHSDTRLLVGNDTISANPKLNNCAKGWRAARYDWVVIADSNVLMPPDYLRRLMQNVTKDTCLVVSMPWGTRAQTFFAEVECTLLNTFQARWQFAAAAVGQPFAQGKNMLWRRDVLDSVGGLVALGVEPAEDAAATRLVRALGKKVRLVDMPFEQPLGVRSLRAVWARHTRWGRLRRATFPIHFLPEILTGAVPPVALAVFSAHGLGENAIAAAVLVASILYGSELALAVRCGMPFRWSTLPAMAVRDLMLPAFYVDAWLFDGFTWHGQEMSVSRVDQDTGRVGA